MLKTTCCFINYTCCDKLPINMTGEPFFMKLAGWFQLLTAERNTETMLLSHLFMPKF